MKKLKVFTVLFMLSLMMMVPRVAQAAQDVSENGISVTNIGTTTAYVDWSGVAANYADKNLTGTYKVVWWSTFRGDNLVIDGTTSTSAQLTNLPSGELCCISVYAYYTDEFGDIDTVYASAFFNTDGIVDGNVDIGTVPDTPNPGTNTNPGSDTTGQQPIVVTLQTPTVSKAYMSEENLEALAAN